MYNIDKIVFKSILKKKFSSLVRESCKRIELLRDNTNIDYKTKCTLFRDLIRELDYEAMRDIESCVESFSNGVTIQVDLTKPER